MRCHMEIKLPVTWEVCDFVTIEADSIDEAIEKFKETEDDIPLPTEPDYVDGSFSLSTEDPEIIRFYNEEDTFTDDR